MPQYLQKLDVLLQYLYLPGKHVAVPSVRFIVQLVGSFEQASYDWKGAYRPLGQVTHDEEPTMSHAPEVCLPAGQVRQKLEYVDALYWPIMHRHVFAQPDETDEPPEPPVFPAGHAMHEGVPPLGW